MFTYILYILPLSETVLELCNKIESYKDEVLFTELYSDTGYGICIGIHCANEINVEKVIWETLEEGVIPQGSYWSIHIGFTATASKNALKEKYKEYINNIDFNLPEDEITEIVDRNQEKYQYPQKFIEKNDHQSEATWRFL